VGLLADLGDGPVGLDSSIFIYFVEENAEFLPLVRPIFTAIDRGDLEAVTSAITLLEVLVVPIRAGATALADRYEELLTGSRGLWMVPLGLPLLRRAAELRAALRVRTPDALQLAAAIATGCTAFLTNDGNLRAPEQLRVLRLKSYRADQV
jgi:predicted nucleic acid-binding protein